MGAYNIFYWSSTHKTAILAAGIPFLCVIIIPLLFTFFKLRISKRSHKDYKHIIKYFPFFVLGFQERFYYWEFIIISRTTIINFFVYLYKGSANSV